MAIICAMGAASQDVFLSGESIKAHRDPKTRDYVEAFKLGAKLDIDEVVYASGGGATNAAVTFARQGIDSHFIGRVGKDIAAHAVLQELDEEHVNTSDVIVDSKLGTQYSTILLAENGERTILIYRGAAQGHHVSEYKSIDFSKFDWLYLSTFSGAMNVLSEIITSAKEHGVKIAFNPGAAELEQALLLKGLLEDVDVLIVNKEEAKKIVHGEDLEELARHATHYCETVVVSDGPHGVIATDGKTIVEAGMYEDVPVLDRTGAGDAFGSGFLSQLARGKSLKDSVIFASANSTSVVTKIGAKEGILHHGTKLHDMPIKERPF